MERGEKTVGSFFESGSTAALEMMGLTGLDYVVIDTEHGPFDAERAGEFVCAAERHNLTPLARVNEISRPAILRLLDVGCKGLIVPQVHRDCGVRQVLPAWRAGCRRREGQLLYLRYGRIAERLVQNRQ